MIVVMKSDFHNLTNRTTLSRTDTLWHTMVMDIGQLKVGTITTHFLLMMDEASHFAVAAEVFRTGEGESRNATTQEIIQAIERF